MNNVSLKAVKRQISKHFVQKVDILKKDLFVSCNIRKEKYGCRYKLLCRFVAGRKQHLI